MTKRPAPKHAESPRRKRAARSPQKPGEPRSPRKAEGDAPTYKMKHVVERTGVPREVIHFYIQQGLVPEGQKTGRNMAYYGEEHIARIELVRRLQHERFLPLKVIKAMLDQRDEAFSPPQRRLLQDVKEHLAGSPLLPPDRPTPVDARRAARDAGLDAKALVQLADTGLLALHKDGRGRLTVAADDVWLVQLWGELQAVGLTEELGFSAADLLVYEDAVSGLFREESRLLRERLERLPPEQLASLIERALPLINTLIARWHTGKIRAFFATLGDSP